MSAYIRSKRSGKNVFDKTITIRCTSGQHEAWSDRADTMGMSLNQFIRMASNQLAKQDKISVQNMNIK